MPIFQSFAKNEQGEPVLVAYFPHAKTYQPYLKPDGTIGMNVIEQPGIRQLTAKNIAWQLEQCESFKDKDPEAISRNEKALSDYSLFRHMLMTYTAALNPQQPTVPRAKPLVAAEEENFSQRATA